MSLALVKVNSSADVHLTQGAEQVSTLHFREKTGEFESSFGQDLVLGLESLSIIESSMGSGQQQVEMSKCWRRRRHGSGTLKFGDSEGMYLAPYKFVAALSIVDGYARLFCTF